MAVATTGIWFSRVVGIRARRGSSSCGNSQAMLEANRNIDNYLHCALRVLIITILHIPRNPIPIAIIIAFRISYCY